MKDYQEHDEEKLDVGKGPEVPRDWELDAETRAVIEQGGVEKTHPVGPTRTATAESDTKQEANTGKVLTDDREPGVSTHIHRHADGVTISVKDENKGVVERFNLNTGEGFEKKTADMGAKEAERRMRSVHTDYNPNPDRDSIPGFHSSVWPAQSDQSSDTDEGES